MNRSNKTLPTRPSTQRIFLWATCVMLVGFLTPGINRVSGEELLSSSKFFQQLSAPLSIVVDGQPFRDCVMHVAKQSEINVWIDRQVDPSATIHPGQTGPTVFAALQTIAQQRDCVVMPVANVVLIGRPAWVDSTSAALITCPTSSTAATIQWDEMTTPTVAYAAATGDAGPSDVRLPHDLWPATKLRLIKRPIAANLVLSQFGRHLSSTKTMDPKTSLTNKSDQTVTRGYSTSDEIKSAFSDSTAKFKTAGKKTFVTALPTAHRLATAILFSKKVPANAKPNRFRADDRQFSLKLENKPAGAAIKSFASTAGAKCIIAPQAAEAASKLVSLEATNKTLAQLIDMVAEKSGLKATWADDTLTIDLAR